METQMEMCEDICDNNCPICMDAMDITKNCIITECGHRFHASCLMQNVVHNGFGCPYCRTSMANDDNSTESTEIIGEDESEYSYDSFANNEPYSSESMVGFRFLFRRNDPNENGEEEEEEEDEEEEEEEEDDDETHTPNPDIDYVIQKFREKYQYEDLVKIICLDYDFRMCDRSAPNMDEAFDYIENISIRYMRNSSSVAVDA